MGGSPGGLLSSETISTSSAFDSSTGEMGRENYTTIVSLGSSCNKLLTWGVFEPFLDLGGSSTGEITGHSKVRRLLLDVRTSQYNSNKNNCAIPCSLSFRDVKVVNAVSIRHQRPFRAATAADDGLIVFHQGQRIVS